MFHVANCWFLPCSASTVSENRRFTGGRGDVISAPRLWLVDLSGDFAPVPGHTSHTSLQRDTEKSSPITSKPEIMANDGSIRFEGCYHPTCIRTVTVVEVGWQL
jgi:hypothetical protein